jgi:hypothetical protein
MEHFQHLIPTTAYHAIAIYILSGRWERGTILSHSLRNIARKSQIISETIACMMETPILLCLLYTLFPQLPDTTTHDYSPMTGGLRRDEMVLWGMGAFCCMS